jgi:O-antigen/teichoic acid export membrane protein
MSETMLAPGERTFRSFAATTARGVAGRRGGALVLVAAVLALPALTGAATVTAFTWAYVGMLTLTSLLGLGAERLATLLVAERGSASPADALRPLVLVRIATVPVSALALWALVAFVHADLPIGAAVAAVGWIAAVHLGVLAAAGLRSLGDARTEPRVIGFVRCVQAGALVGVAALGAGATTLVVLLALLEAAGALRLMAAVADVERDQLAGAHGPRTPLGGWRRVVALAGIETVGLLYLRADLLLVGHLLGAGPGATYGLLYRVVDGAGGAAGTASLWLFADAAAGRDGGDDRSGVRSRSLHVLPAVACAVGVVAVVGAGALGALVPRFADDVGTLRLLIAVVPMLVWNALELHVRAARGRHAGVLVIGLAALLVNVVLCVVLVGDHGLRGAAVALLAAELVQTVALVASSRLGERPLVTRSALLASAGCLVLVGVAVALGGVW